MKFTLDLRYFIIKLGQIIFVGKTFSLASFWHPSWKENDLTHAPSTWFSRTILSKALSFKCFNTDRIALFFIVIKLHMMNKLNSVLVQKRKQKSIKHELWECDQVDEKSDLSMNVGFKSITLEVIFNFVSLNHKRQGGNFYSSQIGSGKVRKSLRNKFWGDPWPLDWNEIEWVWMYNRPRKSRAWSVC